MLRSQRALPAMLIVGFTTMAIACSGGGDAVEENSGAGAVAAPAADSGMAGMDHSAQNMGRPAAQDADHDFLRMMSDHHEGMIKMATAAMTKASAPVQGEAHEMHTKQVEEQKRMIDMIQSSYGETLIPMVMPSNQQMIQTLESKTSTEYDQSFYQQVIAHHEEAIRMVDEMTPRLTKPEVQQMAQKMKADQQAEITELKAKLSQS